jgi:hypothetical protein
MFILSKEQIPEIYGENKEQFSHTKHVQQPYLLISSYCYLMSKKVIALNILFDKTSLSFLAFDHRLIDVT